MEPGGSRAGRGRPPAGSGRPRTPRRRGRAPPRAAPAPAGRPPRTAGAACRPTAGSWPRARSISSRLRPWCPAAPVHRRHRAGHPDEEEPVPDEDPIPTPCDHQRPLLRATGHDNTTRIGHAPYPARQASLRQRTEPSPGEDAGGVAVAPGHPEPVGADQRHAHRAHVVRDGHRDRAAGAPTSPRRTSRRGRRAGVRAREHAARFRRGPTRTRARRPAG